jgi:hypothetical protein
MTCFKNATLSCATVFVAVATGFLLQSSAVAEMRNAPTVAHAQEDVTDFRDTDVGNNPLELTSIAYTSAPASPECHAILTARSMAAAMVDLSLSAPCKAGARVTLHHNGMMITERMDDAGHLAVELPALSATAVYMAAFETGLTAVAQAEISTLEIYDRVVVQWQGPGDMQIHAFEFGAGFGDAGHVWSQAAHSLERAALGKGGFMTQHGRAMPDQDLRAQVYTFPSGTSAQSGEILLTVETPVTDRSCGRRMEGQAFQIKGGGALSVTDLSLDMPGCDATGGFLVLKNLLQDMNISRN